MEVFRYLERYLIFPLRSFTIGSLAVLWTVKSWRASTADTKTPMNRIRLAWRESSDFWKIFNWIQLAGERERLMVDLCDLMTTAGRF